MLNQTLTRSVMDMRRSLLDALLRADASAYTSLQPGAAVTKVVNDPNQVLTLLSGTVVSILRDGLPAIAMLGYLLYLNWQLTLLSMITTPAMAFVVKKVTAACSRSAHATMTRSWNWSTRWTTSPAPGAWCAASMRPTTSAASSPSWPARCSAARLRSRPPMP